MSETVLELTPPAGPVLGGTEHSKKLAEDRKLFQAKMGANVRVYEKMNVNDRKPWGTHNPLGAGYYLCGLSQDEAAEILKQRIEDGKQKYGGPSPSTKDAKRMEDGRFEADLVYSRIWTEKPHDGWIYSEAYYKAQDMNLLLRAIVFADGRVEAY